MKAHTEGHDIILEAETTEECRLLYELQDDDEHWKRLDGVPERVIFKSEGEHGYYWPGMLTKHA